MEKYKTSLFAVIFIEIIGIFLMMAGFLPRETSLFFAGIFLFFVLFAPLKHAVLFFLFSIPLYTALPISDSFDMMASWRIIVAVLFLRVFMKRGWGIVFWRICRLFWHGLRLHYLYRIRSRSKTAEASEATAGWLRMSQKIMPHPLSTRLGILVSLFFVLGVLSLFVAQEPIFGIKKLLYLANIFALFFVVRSTIKSRKDFLSALKYLFAGSMIVLSVGYAQFLAILFIPLYTFWQWWAQNVIPIFYGQVLSNLLSYSNTWFSYYNDAEATLRIFSIFPDSHSFALFMVLSLPIVFTLLVQAKGNKIITALMGIVSILILFSIILSGTRGVWIGVAPIFFVLVAAYFLLRHLRINNLKILKFGILSIVIFALLFPVSSQLLKFSQMLQGGKVSDKNFERISTSFNTQELSNKGRIQIWESTFSSIVRHPVLGVGIGNYPVVLGENFSATKKGASAHSLYLDIAAEMGIFAVILLLLIFFEILWKSIKIFITSKDRIFGAFAGFFAIYLLWVMSYSIVDVVLLNDKVLLMFTILVSLLYVSFNQHSSLQRRR